MAQHFRIDARLMAGPGCRYPKEFYLTAARARAMVKAGKIHAVGSDGRTFEVVPPGRLPPRREPLTRISRGGPMAAAGMSQVMTTANERGNVDGLKTIYSEDRPAFLLSPELYGVPAPKGIAAQPAAKAATAAA